MALIDGKIIDRDTGEPLAYTAVDIAGITRITDLNGNFQIDGVPAKKVPITVRNQFYRPITRTFDVQQEHEVLEISVERISL